MNVVIATPKIGADMGMPESTVRNIVKREREIKEEGNIVYVLWLANIYKE
jgi:hypothetical protein